jgi:glycosyltransferase involved in cell wall biosynthesis
MRILQVVHGFPPRESAGAELVTFYLSQALRAHGHKVTILTRIEDPGAVEFSVREEQVDGLPVVQIVNNHVQTSAALRFSYDNSFCDAPFLQLLERFCPDVVHFQHLAHLSMSLVPLAVSLGYPTVLSLHDFFSPCHRIHLIDAQTRLCPGPEQGERCVPCLEGFAPPEEIRRRFSYMAQVLQAPDRVIAPSSFLAEKMLGYFPIPRERLHVIPLGVKPVPINVQERRTGMPLRILYVGFLFPPKGAHLLIQAIKGLPPQAVEVSLYGASSAFWQSYADRVCTEAQGLPVHFYGPYAHDQLAAILASHDVLVMPMICEETFSIITREALLAGLPVIAARRGALPEVVQDGVNGLLFEAENAADLQRCLARLIAEPELVQRLRPLNPSVKTMAKYAQEMEEMYRQLCAVPFQVPVLQKRLLEQYQIHTALSQEYERLRAEAQELEAQNVAARAEQEYLGAETLRMEQERDRVLATGQELNNALDLRERDLREHEARLAAIYASTTWKLYCSYAAGIDLLVHRPLGKLRLWFRRW